MSNFKTPKTGDLFARPGNDGMTVLVIHFSHFEDDESVVYGITLCPGDFSPMGAPRLMFIRPTDTHVCKCFPLPFCAQLALIRQQQITAFDAAPATDDFPPFMVNWGNSGKPMPAAPTFNDVLKVWFS